METQTYSSEPWEKYEDLTGSLTTLEELGVDAESLDPEYKLIAQVNLLNTAQRQYKESNTADLNPAANHLSLTATTVEEAIAMANAGAASTTPQHKERVLELFERAIDRAMTRAVTQFRRRGDEVFDLMRGPFTALAERLTETREKIPKGVLNIEDAARLRLSEEWVQLEKTVAQWRTIEGLINDLYASKVINRTPGSDKYSPVDFMIEDREAYAVTLANRGNIHATADAIIAGRPDLRPAHKIERTTYTEPLSYDQAAKRAWEANERDKTAREALGIPRPA